MTPIVAAIVTTQVIPLMGTIGRPIAESNVSMAPPDDTASRDAIAVRDPSLCRGADRRGMHTAARPEGYQLIDAVHELTDGRLVATERDCHPNSIAEAFRRRITVLERQQIIGRGRGLWRTADKPAARAGADRCSARHAGRGTDHPRRAMIAHSDVSTC